MLNICRFPADKARRLQWLSNISQGGWEPSKYSLVCSKHFKPDDYEPVAQFRYNRSLKSSAVPSLYLNRPENAQPLAKKRKLVELEPLDELERLEEQCLHVASPEGGIGEESRVDGGRSEGWETRATKEARSTGDEANPSSALLPPKLVAKLQEHVAHDHDYDEIEVVKLKKQLKRAREKIINYQQKIQILQRTGRRRKKKCQSMKEILVKLKKQGLLHTFFSYFYVSSHCMQRC